MRSLSAFNAIALVCLSLHSHAENPFHHKKEMAVVALHVADAVMTHVALNNSCQCFQEANPLAPKSGSWGAQMGYHAALGGLALGGAYWFRHRDKPKYGNFLLWESIAVESVAVTSDAIVLAKH